MCDSADGIASGYGLAAEESEFDSRYGQDLSPSLSCRVVLGPTQLPVQWVQGAYSSVVKRPGREADHSTPTGAEVKNMWIYTSTPPHVFVA
jgi:hypothetical protein